MKHVKSSQKEMIIAGFEKALALPPGRFLVVKPGPPASDRAVTVHAVPRFVMILEGTRRERVSDETPDRRLEIAAGDFCFYRRFSWNFVEYPMDCEGIGVVFYPEYSRVQLVRYSRADDTLTAYTWHVECPLDIVSFHVLTALEALGADASRRPAAGDLSRALIRLVLDALRIAPERRGKAAETWAALKAYALDHYAEDLTRETLATHFRLNKNYVSNMFRRHAGKNFKDYILELRTREAAELLTGASLTVDEIAGQCGFRQTSYFIRIFRRYYGKTPLAYRLETRDPNNRIDNRLSRR